MKPRESKPRSKCVWVHKDKGTEEKICLGPLEEESRPRKVNPYYVVEDFFFTKMDCLHQALLLWGGVVAHLDLSISDETTRIWGNIYIC